MSFCRPLSLSVSLFCSCLVLQCLSSHYMITQWLCPCMGNLSRFVNVHAVVVDDWSPYVSIGTLHLRFPLPPHSIGTKTRRYVSLSTVQEWWNNQHRLWARCEKRRHVAGLRTAGLKKINSTRNRNKKNNSNKSIRHKLTTFNFILWCFLHWVWDSHGS